MNKHEKGFSTIEVLVIIIFVAVIGAVGWFVLDSQKITETEQQPLTNNSIEAQKAADVETPETSIPEGWKKYDSNSHFSFIYPNEWASAPKVLEFPTSQEFQIRYIGDVKLNEKLDGWIHTTTDNDTTTGSKADVIQEEGNSGMKVWRFGFGDGGYGSLTPTFVANGKIYQIGTGHFCPEKTADCMTGEEYKQFYDKVVGSITLK